jgi:tetratricopeptide (TPR) repeat protein
MLRIYTKLTAALVVTATILFASYALLAQSMESVPALYLTSYEQEASGDYAAALDALEAMPDEVHTEYVYRLRRGWLLYLAGAYEASLAAYEDAVEAAPDAIEPRLGLMLPQMALWRWQDAEQTAEAVLARDASNLTARRRLALVLFKLGRYAEAEQLHREVLRQYPADVEMQAGLGWALLMQGETARAGEVFRRVLRVSPDEATALAGLSEIVGG